MAAFAESEDVTDADFFDRLVDDNDEGTRPAAADRHEAEAPDLVPVATEAAGDGVAGAPPEGGSPESGTGVHTAVKQVQWSVFGGGVGGGADTFGDFSAGGGGREGEFFGNAAGDQGMESSVVGSNMAGTDHSFFGGVDQNAEAPLERSGSSVDSTDPKYLECLYPGWKYDAGTLQWYQVDVFAHNGSGTAVAGREYTQQQQQQQFGVSYLQNSVQTVLETIAEESTVGSVSGWGQDGSIQGAAAEYPPNMLFYVEYPGWYFDTNTQQWSSLESYHQAVAQTVASAASGGLPGANHNVAQTENSFAGSYSQQSQRQPDVFGNSVQHESFTDHSLAGSFYSSDQHAMTQISQQAGAEPLELSTSNHMGFNTFEPSTSHYNGNKGLESSYLQSGYNTSDGHQAGYNGFKPSMGHHYGYNEPSADHQVAYRGHEPSTGHQAGDKGFQPSTGHHSDYRGLEPSTSYGYGNVNGMAKSQGFLPMESSQLYRYLGTENSMNFHQQHQQPLLTANAPNSQFGYTPHEERSSAGRPPHALAAFGFGGKLLVMKGTSSMTTNFNSVNQDNSSGMLSVLNISEVVADKVDASSIADTSALSYFNALCRQPIPGPLVGGTAAAKDVNKWLDEMITWYELSVNELQEGDHHKLLISLLKILCQHYGKLCSPFGSDPSEEGVDGPQMAVTNLFSSSKSSNVHKGEFGSIVHCMKNLPSQSQIQTTAQEVQNLLVSGRRKEALQYAQEGQLWGPALILALQLGDKFYVDTVKKMAHCHFVSGSPLRTLCLLIAGQPGDVFNVENPVNNSYGALSTPQQPMEAMLDDWEENLAIITANRTKSDDLVVTHLGDCLWKEKNQVAAAHSCYLVAEVNIDSYSESARLCLIGADHLKCRRTFASPEAIQRTEVYEYAKVLGNSQYILLPFQPYKLIYAYMLAEVGRVSDSLRYCQASLKVLKAVGRAPELEALKQLFSSLEERIRTHQQGGYGTNLAPAKLVGKIFTSLDKSISRMMGTQSAPLPPLPQGSVNDRGSYSAPAAPTLVNSQLVMAASSLMPSASVQSMSDMSGNNGNGRKIAHNRSVSEPDFGRTPRQGAGSDSTQSSTSGSGSSRFGWFSSTLQRTMGLVSRSHREARLGEENKFYYDEKLKRWMERGAEVLAEEPPLPPPPTNASFQNGIPGYNLNGPMSIGYTPNGLSEPKQSNPSELGAAMPPIPPSQNQFSARGRMGVRSRYVDTFNKGGASAAGAVPSYNKLATPSLQPLSGAKFFVPAAAAVSAEQMPDQTVESHSNSARQGEHSPPSPAETSLSSAPPPAPSSLPMASAIQRHLSLDHIGTPNMGSGTMLAGATSSFSRPRAASWSGTYSGQFSTIAGSRSPGGQTVPSTLAPSSIPLHSRTGSASSAQLSGLSEDLQEVEL